MPFSLKLVRQGRDDEVLSTLAWLRKLPVGHELSQIEGLEMKAEAIFEERAFAKACPKLAAKKKRSVFMNQVAKYANCFITMDNFKRVCTAWIVMFSRQWSGIDASKFLCFFNKLTMLTSNLVIDYASVVFKGNGLTGGTVALLTTVVTGVVFIVSTVLAMVSDIVNTL